MPPTPLQPPDHPIALRRSHLLAPAPDRLTNTPTTLTVTRENTHSGRDFSIHQLRKDEPLDSLRRSTLLYTVFGRLWSNSQYREIRDSNGRPLLELRRIWWRGQWILKRAGAASSGSASDELLSAEMRWGIGMKIGVRFINALVSSREGLTLPRASSRGPTSRSSPGLTSGRPRTATPASGPGSTSASAAAAASTAGNGSGSGSVYTRPTPTRRRTISNYPHAPPIAVDAPPPYSLTMPGNVNTRSRNEDNTNANTNANANANINASANLSTNDSSATPSASAASSSTSLSSTDTDSDAKSRSTVLPSYESVRRMRLQDSRHSLRELLDAIEPPEEPAPASAASYPTQRRWSESCIDPRVELKVVQASGTVGEVFLGNSGKKVVHVRRGRALDIGGRGRRVRWEVEIAEGVDLLLVSFTVIRNSRKGVESRGEEKRREYLLEIWRIFDFGFANDDI